MKRFLLILFILFSISGVSYGACPDGMLSYWSFDDDTVSGSTVQDAYSTYDGTITGAPNIVNGMVDEALDFDGSNDYVFVDTAPAESNEAPFTYMAWAKMHGYTGTVQYIIGNGAQSYSEGGMLCYVETANELRWWGQTNDYLGRTATTFDTSDWFYIVGTWDGTLDNDAVKFYMNGQLVNSSTPFFNENDPQVSGLGIASLDNWPGSYSFNGTIDEVAIFDRALSSSEISGLYQNSSNGIGYCSNQPPTVSLNSPLNGGNDMPTSTMLNVTVFDNDGDNMNVSFFNGIPWDLNYAVYNNKSLAIQDGYPRDLFFKGDGTKLYEVGDGAYGGKKGRVYQYTCFEPWEVTSCFYDNVNLTIQDNLATDIFFKSDGTKFYEIGGNTNKIYQYSCSNPWELSSCTYSGVSISTQDSSPSGMSFKSDGSRLYEIGAGSNKIYQYSCSTAWGLSSCTYTGVTKDTGLIGPCGLFFSPEGDKLYEIGYQYDKLYQNSCSTPWDVSSCTSDNKELSLRGNGEGVFFKPDGSKMYEMDYFGYAVHQWSIGNLLNEDYNVKAGTDSTYRWENLSNEQEYIWYVNIDDGLNNIFAGPWNFTTISKLPLATSFTSNPRTTNFSEVSNISEVENLTLATNHGVISFGNRTVNAENQDYDNNIIFGDCFVAVNATNLDYTFNATAYLMMNNSDGHCGDNTIFTTNQVVADAGAIKSGASICKDCEYITTDGDLAKYRVPHFSSYAIGSNSNMTIDANDPKQVNQQVTFTAVYRNSSDGSFISGATCDIELYNGTTDTLTEGTEQYTYQTSFTSNGTYTYNVTCSATGYQTLQTDDNFTITNQVEQIPEFNTLAILLLVIAVLIMVFKFKGDKR